MLRRHNNKKLSCTSPKKKESLEISQAKLTYFCVDENIYSYHINHPVKLEIYLTAALREPLTQIPKKGLFIPPLEAIQHHAEGLDTEQLAGTHFFLKDTSAGQMIANKRA